MLYRGTFRGGDPRQFSPEPEACTPEQLANHRAACQRWSAAEAAGQLPPPEPSQEDAVQNTAFGVGWHGEIEAPDFREEIRNLFGR